MFENIFETVNSGLAQAMYEDFLRDPGSVPAEWRVLFENGLQGETPADVAASPTPTPSAVAAPAGPAVPNGGTAEPIKGPAFRLVQNMEASLAIPTATSFREIDMTRLWDLRKSFNAQLADRNLKLSFTHVIGWAIVQALRDFPTLYHVLLREGDAAHRFVPDGPSLGLAVDVERRDGSRGLLVPVIKRADLMTFVEFHREYERVVAGARQGKLLPDAYQGATLTLTNPGTIGTVASVPRLMTGQGSIVATGAIRTVGSARLMTITSTYDHRIIQGAESGSFLQRIDGLLQGADDFYEGMATEFALTVEPPAPAASPRTPAETPTLRTGSAVAQEMLYHVAAAMSLVKAHRTHGYLAAQLDPLGTKPVGDPALNPEPLGLTPETMAGIPTDVLRVYVPGRTLAEAFPQLREVYCRTIAYELEHIAAHDERVWLRRVIESGEHRTPLATDDQRRLLDILVRVEGLESFLHRAYLGHKRFGIEGLDALVPILHWAIDAAAENGTSNVVLGMAHRGRLNVLTHVLGVSYETLLAEFEGGREVEETLAPKGGTGDVKYHHGASGVFRSANEQDVSLTLMPNPSHLEAVGPVVEGYARAVQTLREVGAGSHRPERCFPILVHGDAAFAGQGVVAETFNLTNLKGYDTGGTLHIIVNNQVGFTTAPREARSTDFASDLAKGFDVPIVHVNADDPEACIAAVRLAMMYRRRYGKDCVIDLVGYRRHGHNEGDEPRYTQPSMYRVIDDHPTVRQLYADRLIEAGVVTPDQVNAKTTAQYNLLLETQKKLQEDVAGEDRGEEPVRTVHPERVREPDTAVSPDILEKVNQHLLVVPNEFTIHHKLKRQLERRPAAFEGKAGIDWAHAEALALGSLLYDGTPIRLTGQDTERGTFSHRHMVLHDVATGQEYAPIQHLPRATASFELHNSALSEYGVLGFEYGYSVQAPDALVLWEAQFGDFANGAEIIIDQFIVAGLAKWGQTSRLVLLLPHGYEGQGPEHSSARLERFLALTAEDNIRVANCSTPAQYFHILRRQALHEEPRPMVMMTPKSLLRLPQAVSRINELAEGRFHPVLDDPTVTDAPMNITRLVMCSGKVYYDIIGNARRPEAGHVAVGRIELLYPFPTEAMAQLLERYSNVKEIVWVQEEPSNFGGRKWMVPQLAELAGTATVTEISRPERSSPAEGYPAAHKAEQHRIVSEALQ